MHRVVKRADIVRPERGYRDRSPVNVDMSIDYSIIQRAGSRRRPRTTRDSLSSTAAQRDNAIYGDL